MEEKKSLTTLDPYHDNNDIAKKVRELEAAEAETRARRVEHISNFIDKFDSLFAEYGITMGEWNTVLRHLADRFDATLNSLTIKEINNRYDKTFKSDDRGGVASSSRS